MSTQRDIEQLKTMVRNEEATSRLYKLFAEKFPQLKDFWTKLVDEEVDHAAHLAEFYKKVETGEMVLDEGRFSMLAVEAFAEHMKRILEYIAGKDITARDALEMALDVEETFLEKSFFEVIETDSPDVEGLLNTLSVSTEQHRERIKEKLREVAGITILTREVPGKITFQGNPLDLTGRLLKTANPAPDFIVVSQEFNKVSLGDFSGKIKVITTFPSLDTPVCDLQVKEFNKRATGFSDKVAVLAVSCDLPFAQTRFCQANGIKNVQVVSDFQTFSFGINYGLLIKELKVLARSVMIVDEDNIVRYVQVVGELTHAPDYQEVVTQLTYILEHPHAGVYQKKGSHCVPCEGGTPHLSKEDIATYMSQHRMWEIEDEKKIVRTFKFSDYSATKLFCDCIAEIAKTEGHHPTIVLGYNRLKVGLTTHSAGGLTENDFIMAGIIDKMYAR
jgi:thiol peroxidase